MFVAHLIHHDVEQLLKEVAPYSQTVHENTLLEEVELLR